MSLDRGEFAAERRPILARAESELLGSVKYALRADRWDSVIRRANTLMRRTYRSDSGRRTSPALRKAEAEFDKNLRASLDKVKPDDDGFAAQASRIASSIAAYAVSTGTAVAADDSQDDVVLVWLSMDDEKVRPTHKAADGQTRRPGQKFEVGGVEMSRPGDVTVPIELWINCRCVLGIDVAGETASDAAPVQGLNNQALLTEDPQGVEMTDTLVEPDVTDVMDDISVPWHGVLAPEDVRSGDGRKFGAEALRWRDLPLPLAWQKVNDEGHKGSVVVGRIDEIWRDGNLVRAKGAMLSTPEADEAVGLISEGGIRGVSVDVDDATMQLEDESGGVIEDMDALMAQDGVVIQNFTDGRICGATLCAIPAFMEAAVYLGAEEPEVADGDAALSHNDDHHDDDVPESLAAGGQTDYFNGELEQDAILEYDTELDSEFVKTEDGPGWLTHPVDTERLRRYWTKGKGAAKIRWGVPGDFNRCRVLLGKYVKPQYLSGYCANRHYDALGFWPGRPVAGETVDFSLADPPLRIVAPKVSDLPSKAWFSDPHLVGPSPVVVTQDGRVFGHIAEWDTCHIGYGEAQCIVAPPSATNYAYFLTGAVLTDDGDVPVGHITIGTGHAEPDLTAMAAIRHYDHTGTVVADVAVGEDEFGIWCAGTIRPGASEESVYALRASALSGDWRNLGGNLELVATLAVNVPGFPISRTTLAASGGRQTSLVASGIVTPLAVSESASVEQITDRVLAELTRRAAREKMSLIAVQAGRDPKSRMLRLRGE